MSSGNIPVLNITGDTIPRAYEMAIKEVWDKGASIRTEYDRPDDPPSRDATVMITVEDPFAQPRFHRSFADGLGGLSEYVMEVVHGAHDYWIKPREEILKGTESTDTRWTYTYHRRLVEYEMEDRVIDQIDYMVKKLSQTGFSRRAQGITWNAVLDPPTDHPPCLQRVWGRLLEDGQGDLVFNMNTHWRSRDLYKAWFENVIALTTFMRKIADRISRRDIPDRSRRALCRHQRLPPHLRFLLPGNRRGRGEGDQELFREAGEPVIRREDLEPPTSSAPSSSMTASVKASSPCSNGRRTCRKR